MIDEVMSRVDEALDRSYLTRTLTELARIPTNVELGFDTLMQPDDPKLVRYVQQEIRPRLVELGGLELIDAPRNNLVVGLGSGESPRSLLIENYTPSQHHNLMRQPFDGVVRGGASFGRDEPIVLGQGVSKNKAHQAVMLAVLKVLCDLAVSLRGRLYWAVNNEGRSTHECTYAVLEALDRKPEFAILQTAQKLQVSLGNRGRLDLAVTVEGAVAHSSTPDAGLNALDGAMEVVRRLRALSWANTHPQLGSRQAIVYKLDLEPKAPHTIPSRARLTIDRRLLPGDGPEDAVREIKEVIGDLRPFRVDVEPGVMMFPAIVDRANPGVRALQAAVAEVRGQEALETFAPGTFDAGGLCRRGIPAVMFGAGGEGDWPIGDDFVAFSDVEDEARILARLILGWLR